MGKKIDERWKGWQSSVKAFLASPLAAAGQERDQRIIELEDALYESAFIAHQRGICNQHFERCEYHMCERARSLLGITGYGHRWDKTYREAQAKAIDALEGGKS